MSTDPMSTAKKLALETAPARKFMFDRSFDDATVVHRAQERKPVLMSPDQIDALKKESFDAGFEAGKPAGKDEQIDRQNKTMSQIDRNLTILVKLMNKFAQEEEAHARNLSLAIAKKILPSFTAQNGLQEIENLVNDTLREMGREPRLVVRVHEAEFDALNEKIQEIATQRAFSGQVIILADADVSSGDCRIEWADGGIERNTPATMDAIEQTILPSA